MEEPLLEQEEDEEDDGDEEDDEGDVTNRTSNMFTINPLFLLADHSAACDWL